jgi:hypothetical protein
VLKCDFLNLNIGPKHSQPIIKPEVNDCAFNSNRQPPDSSTSDHNTKHAAQEDVPISTSSSSALSGELLQLPRGSFDAVAMSLVLSYLPNPDLRMAMIQKARELLIEPGEMIIADELSMKSEGEYDNQSHAVANMIPCPHNAGLLFLVEKESIFSMGKYSKALIDDWRESICEAGFDYLRYELLSHGSPKSHAFVFKTRDHSPKTCANDEHVSEYNKEGHLTMQKKRMKLHESDSTGVDVTKAVDYVNEDKLLKTLMTGEVRRKGKRMPKLWIRQDFNGENSNCNPSEIFHDYNTT